MDVNLWAALIGIMAGGIGYWFTTFSVQPILRFRDLKNKTLEVRRITEWNGLKTLRPTPHQLKDRPRTLPRKIGGIATT